MTTNTIIGYAVFISIALSVGVVGTLVLGIFIDASGRLRGRVFPLVYPLIGFAIALSSLLSGRNLAYGDLLVSMGAVEPTLTRWLLRVMTVVILAAGVAVIVTYTLDRKAQRRTGVGLLVTFAIFFVTNTVLNSIFGSKPDFVHNLIYPAVVVAGAYAARGFDVERSIRAAKVTLLMLLLISCAAAIMLPDVALQRPYRGWIPVLTFRLWGVGSNANSIGPLALLYVLVASHQPFKRWWVQWLGFGAAPVVLVLAQSKTAFVAAIVALGVLWGYRVWEQLGSAIRTGRATLPLGGVIVALLLCSIALLGAVVTVDVAGLMERVFESKAGEQLFTLTGRNVLWGIAIDEWTRNPLFGYGPTMWDLVFRRSIGLAFAFSAHNQFLQSLGSAGSMGLIGLSVYVAALITYALRGARASRGFSLALFVVVLLRCLSEAPLATNTLFNGDFLTHLLLFQTVLGFDASRAQTPIAQTARALRRAPAPMAPPRRGISA